VIKVIKEIKDPKETLEQLVTGAKKVIAALTEPRETWAHRDLRVTKATKETREILEFVEKRVNGESVANKDHEEYKVKQDQIIKIGSKTP
jgi:hypothetical protein